MANYNHFLWQSFMLTDDRVFLVIYTSLLFDIHFLRNKKPRSNWNQVVLTNKIYLLYLVYLTNLILTHDAISPLDAIIIPHIKIHVNYHLILCPLAIPPQINQNILTLESLHIYLVNNFSHNFHLF